MIIGVKFSIYASYRKVETPIKDPPRYRQPPNKERSSGPLSHSNSLLLNLWEEDNLSTEDKNGWSQSVLTQRFHCIAATIEE